MKGVAIRRHPPSCILFGLLRFCFLQQAACKFFIPLFYSIFRFRT